MVSSNIVLRIIIKWLKDIFSQGGNVKIPLEYEKMDVDLTNHLTMSVFC